MESFRRKLSTSGYVNPDELPRGENGRALCRWCGTEVPALRKTFCSRACVHEHRVRSDVAYLRYHVLKRDLGVCALCNLDTEKLSRVVRKLILATALDLRNWADISPFAAFDDNDDLERRFSAFYAKDVNFKQNVLRLSRVKEKYPWFTMDKSPWDADHIVPVVEGGGECGIENIRTLCSECHTVETKLLSERRRGVWRA